MTALLWIERDGEEQRILVDANVIRDGEVLYVENLKAYDLLGNTIDLSDGEERRAEIRLVEEAS